MIEGEAYPDLFAPPSEETLNDFFNFCACFSIGGYSTKDGYSENLLKPSEHKEIVIQTRFRKIRRRDKNLPIISVIIEEGALLRYYRYYKNGMMLSKHLIETDETVKTKNSEVLSLFEDDIQKVSEQELKKLVAELREETEKLYEAN